MSTLGPGTLGTGWMGCRSAVLLTCAIFPSPLLILYRVSVHIQGLLGKGANVTVVAEILLLLVLLHLSCSCRRRRRGRRQRWVRPLHGSAEAGRSGQQQGVGWLG